LAAFDRSDAESFGKSVWLRVIEFSQRASAKQLLEQLAARPESRYFETHSTSDNNVGLGRQLSSFLGAASATGFGAAIEASGCSEAC
jgi:hypothetical protein